MSHPSKQSFLLQMDKLRSQLEEMQEDNQKLLFESKMVMTNVTQWISEQKYVRLFFWILWVWVDF